ncbi:unnamed protein product [Hapterophycus canaliculatus]
MQSLFDVVVCEPVTLDTESDRSVFVSWVRGLSVREVLSQRLADFEAEVSASNARMGKLPAMSKVQLSFRRRGSTAEETTPDEALSQRRQLEVLFEKDTADAYRVFHTMEHFLRQPEHLRGQLQVQLGDATQAWMVERYHELDDSVLREILGKKITSKTRKDLDDVSELTNVPLRSCHRQYDNIQRLLGNLEDSVVLPHISVAKEVRDKLGLPLWLAAKYTAIIFLLHVRFQASKGLQRVKRTTAHMTAYDLCWSGMGMLNYWVGDGKYLGAYEARFGKLEEAEAKRADIETRGNPTGDAEARRQDWQNEMQQGLLTVHGLEFDKKWIRLLRVIKTQLFGDHRSNLFDFLRQRTMADLQAKGLPLTTYDAISQSFRPTVKALASIGSGLSMSKEYRDVFEDLIEKVGNPLRDAGLRLDDTVAFLEALVRGFCRACPLDAAGIESQMVDAWRRYIFGVRMCFRYALRDKTRGSS